MRHITNIIITQIILQKIQGRYKQPGHQTQHNSTGDVKKIVTRLNFGEHFTQECPGIHSFQILRTIKVYRESSASNQGGPRFDSRLGDGYIIWAFFVVGHSQARQANSGIVFLPLLLPSHVSQFISQNILQFDDTVFPSV